MLYLVAVGFNCSNQMAAFRTGGLHTPVRSKAPTFETLQNEYGTSPTNGGVTYDLREIAVGPEVKPQCVVGELDIVGVGINCALNASFIVSVKDAQREVALLTFPLNAGKDLNALAAQLVGTVIRNVIGNEIDIFACIDGNNNGKCADEPIVDINAATADILRGAAGKLCDQTKFGMLLFHKHHSFVAGTASLTVATFDPASQVVQGSLRNLASGATGADATGRVLFPVQLVKSNPDLCPRPAVRTDGCFAKGTQISMTKDAAVPIEKLNPGDRVLLADGRLSKITKMTAGPETIPMIMIETSRGQKLMVTTEHPLLTNQGMKRAEHITISDRLKAADGQFVKIVSVTRKAFTENVYNFELEGRADADHLVIAEGLVSGELYLQNKMAPKGGTAGQFLSGR